LAAPRPRSGSSPHRVPFQQTLSRICSRDRIELQRRDAAYVLTVPRLLEVALPRKTAEHPRRHGLREAEQPARLPQRDAQAGHLLEFRPDTPHRFVPSIIRHSERAPYPPALKHRLCCPSVRLLQTPCLWGYKERSMHPRTRERTGLWITCVEWRPSQPWPR
jgi:hypothetical protein